MSLGIGKGQHVGIWATNYPEWVVAQLATARIGAVLVTVNPAFRPHELDYLLRQSDATSLILISSFKTSDYLAMINEAVPELAEGVPGQLHSQRFPRLRHLILIPPGRPPGRLSRNSMPGNQAPAGIWLWNDIREKGRTINQESLDRHRSQCGPDDVINIQYTSGTTGNPKGVMLTHRNLIANAACTAQRLRLTEQDRLCLPVPLYHCFGCVLGTLLCLSVGATMVLPSEYFDPVQTLAAIEQERCTALHGVPTMFIAELGLSNFDQFDLGSLRTGIMAGAPCPAELMEQVMSRMGATEITIGYGLTEAAPIITLTSPDDTLGRRVNTVGRPLPNVEVKIVDPETGRELPPGAPGELWSRSFMNMKGYYNLPEATAATLDSQGWLHSGDLASMDGDGYCQITGRLKDMIIRGGENIYPREIEEFLYTNPKVADVNVIGVPDAKFGEEVVAWIMLKPGVAATEEEMKEFCRGKIAYYKIPRQIKFVTEFPMTVTGKIQKFRMREMAMAEQEKLEQEQLGKTHYGG
jgi:fatty-acyl-CoA synthase